MLKNYFEKIKQAIRSALPDSLTYRKELSDKDELLSQLSTQANGWEDSYHKLEKEYHELESTSNRLEEETQGLQRENSVLEKKITQSATKREKLLRSIRYFLQDRKNLESETCFRLKEQTDRLNEEHEAEFYEYRLAFEDEYARWEKNKNEELNQLKRNLETTQGGIKHLKDRIKYLEREGIYEIFEKSPLFSCITGLVLDKEFRPLYVTPPLRELLEISKKDYPEMFKKIDQTTKNKIIESAKNPESTHNHITLNQHKYNLKPTVLNDRNGSLGNIFIHLEEPGFLEKMLSIIPHRKEKEETNPNPKIPINEQGLNPA